MGHCYSPAQLHRHRALFGDHRGSAELGSPLDSGRSQKLSARPLSPMAWALLLFLRAYRIFLSPFWGGACKYHPSCSRYATEAIEVHGAGRGVILALKRLGRCRPFKQGGFDPVPSVDELDRERLHSVEAEPLR